MMKKLLAMQRCHAVRSFNRAARQPHHLTPAPWLARHNAASSLFGSCRMMCQAPIDNGSAALGKIDLKERMGISFTCDVCDTRSARYFSRQSYEKGVVLVECKGCNNRHLIADNLGWFDDKHVNVEDIMKEKGGMFKRVEEGSLEISKEDLELFSKQTKTDADLRASRDKETKEKDAAEGNTFLDA